MTDFFAAAVPAFAAVQDAQPTMVPGMPGAAPGAGTTGQPAGATPGGTGGPPAGGFGNFMFLFLIVGMFILMIFLSGRAQRAEKRKKQELLSALKKHDRVQTIGGILGSIVEIRDEEVVLRVDESNNTRMHFAKSAIQQVVRAASGGKGDSADSNEPELTTASQN